MIASSEVDPPTPRERIDPTTFAGIEVPEGATIYKVGAQMRLEALK